eukprot:TRINITY_DN66937_c3_g1_i11.p1 TRINITY_DN66937_c3_g1~~TRINITY_DN66937_c3_g1_i11.p1  ORF type:complete len:782 (-),score=77.05 TRINITY_DN66937_c3_g1_i11:359-2377(-)
MLIENSNTVPLGVGEVLTRYNKRFRCYQIVPIVGVVKRVGDVVWKPREITKFTATNPQSENQANTTYWKFSFPSAAHTLLHPTLKKRHLPQRTQEGEELQTAHGSCQYTKVQLVWITDEPDTTNPTMQGAGGAGLRPNERRQLLPVMLTGSLAGILTIGAKVCINGVFGAQPTAPTTKKKPHILAAPSVATTWEYIHMALSVRVHHDTLSLTRTVSDKSDLIKWRHAVSATPENTLAHLLPAFAPSITGMDHTKRGLLLQLVGGRREQVHAERSNIHILLVGAPGTGKSKLLRTSMNYAATCGYANGRGCTGVGLTGSVEYSQHTAQIRKGLFPANHNGLVCIDEFDKMVRRHRLCVHEAMENGSVTITKAGVAATLPAKCSLLATANPIPNSWSMSKAHPAVYGWGAQLLSRFDLVYWIEGHSRDDKTHWDNVSTALLSAYCTQTSIPDWKKVINDDDHYTTPPGAAWTRLVPQSVLDEQRARDGGRVSTTTHMETDYEEEEDEEDEVVVCPGFLRHLINQAKTFAVIGCNEEAKDLMMKAWLKIHSAPHPQGMVTQRCFGGLHRLAAAHAKLRLSQTITAVDVKVAAGLIRKSIDELMKPRCDTETENHSTKATGCARTWEQLGSGDYYSGDDVAAAKRQRKINPEDEPPAFTTGKAHKKKRHKRKPRML